VKRRKSRSKQECEAGSDERSRHQADREPVAAVRVLSMFLPLYVHVIVLLTCTVRGRPESDVFRTAHIRRRGGPTTRAAARPVCRIAHVSGSRSCAVQNTPFAEPRDTLMRSERSRTMLSTLIVILVLLWLLGLVTSYTLGGFIHILLVVAIVIVLIRIVQGRNPLRG
jgi:hypothetical protein